MAIAYNWNIANLEHNVSDGGVIVAHWRVSAKETVGDDTFTTSAYGTAGFTPDPTAPDFIPYADLTEANVLAWVWGSVDKDEMEANLGQQIEDQKAPKTETGVPW